MRESASPLKVAIPHTGSLTDAVVSAAADAPQSVLLRRRDGREWVDVTAAHFHDEAVRVAKGLAASGVRAGDRVLLISKTRYEWTLLDYAIWWVGAVTVPVYETSSSDQIGWVLRDSGAVAAVVETADHLQRLKEAGGPDQVWQLDGGGLAALVGAGASLSDADLARRRAEVTPESLATLIYTSGTTGRPKGCELTHGNFMFELGVAVDELDELFDPEKDASTLLFLPLAHVFARIVQVGCIQSRVRLGHSSDVSHLVDDLAAFRPTFILAVPRVFEKIFNAASQQARIEGRGRVFNAAVSAAIAYSRALDTGRPRLPLRLRHRLFDRLVYHKLRASLGGRTEYAVSGGAPLGDRLAHFFRGIGVTVLEGYGLTETTAALAVNLPDAQRIGSVGRPVQGTSVRVDEDGELLFKGGQIFRRYWHNEQATSETIDDDGWFHSGDMGQIDDDGYVWVTGRRKEILVTAGGKNVAPAPLEDAIRAHPLVSQCMVVGEAKPFVGALVTLDEEVLSAWAAQDGKSGSVTSLATDPDLVAEVQSAVDRANTDVSKAESVRKFIILTEDWTPEGGQLTPTLKLKRSVVMSQFAADIDALYGRH